MNHKSVIHKSVGLHLSEHQKVNYRFLCSHEAIRNLLEANAQLTRRITLKPTGIAKPRNAILKGLRIPAITGYI